MKSGNINVAIINSNQEIIEGFQLLLTELGYTSVTGHVFSFKKGESDFVKFLKKHKPQVIIYDIAPPYEENWNFFNLLKNAKQASEIVFVLTTTNKTYLEKLVGPTKTFEILGKPFDMKQIVEAVDNAIKKLK